MHEAAIANSIIKKAEEKGKVKSVLIEVGDLAHLSAEELEEALRGMVSWNIMIEGNNYILIIPNTITHLF